MDEIWIAEREEQAREQAENDLKFLEQYIDGKADPHSYEIEAIGKFRNAQSMQEKYMAAYTLMLMDREGAQEALPADTFKRLSYGFSDPCSWGEKGSFDHLRDSTFHLPAGDYLVTDPCYFVKNCDWNPEMGESADMDLNSLGIFGAHIRSTLYGDWSCGLFDEEDGQRVGEFCADAGLVCVVEYNDVLAYNPDFKEWLEQHPWCGCVVRNFSGELSYIVTEFKEGDFPAYHELELHFDGHDALNGGEIHLVGKQTGF